MRGISHGWFRGRSVETVTDFWDVCDSAADAQAAAARALEQSGGTLPEGTVAEQVSANAARMRCARGGDFAPFEEHLATLGADYAERGLELGRWFPIAYRFYASIVPHVFAMYGADVVRTEQVLLVVGDFMQHSLAIVATAYHGRKEAIRKAIEDRRVHMLEASPDPVIAIDLLGNVIEVNHAVEQVFGYAPADAIGRPLATLVIPPRFRDMHTRGLARVVEGGESRLLQRRVEMTAMRSDGSELPVELSIVRDGDRGFVGFLRDLTVQNATEEASALWLHALEQADFGIVVSDRASRTITRANPAYARMVGYTATALIGMSGEQLISPSSPAEIPALAANLRMRRNLTYGLRLLRSDGSSVPVLVSSSPVLTGSGTELLVSTIIDVSEREKLEREREAAAARLEIVANAAHEFASASENVDALLELVARRLAETLGDGAAVRLVNDDHTWLEPSTSFYHRDAATREIAHRVLGSQRQRVGEGIAGRVAATGEALLIPTIDPDHVDELTVRPFADLLRELGAASALAVPLRSRGRTIGVVNMLRSGSVGAYTLEDQLLAQDLADRAGLAIDNAVLVATLERRVRERTADLETLNRDLEAFSYSVSHDLRTPLRAIDGFSRALAEHGDKLDDDGRHFIERIRSSTQRMGRLIEDLLGLARIGRAPVSIGDVDITKLSTDIVAELRKRDEARSVAISIAAQLSARGDSRLVMILLENLLGNAWKFTTKVHDARIEVGARDGAFYVRDNGAGFDMSYASNLFAPFQRMHASSDFQGEGIGLATVARIVAHHRGRIWAEAAVRRGATFFFTLGDH